MALIYRGSYLYNDIRLQKVNYCDISRQKKFLTKYHNQTKRRYRDINNRYTEIVLHRRRNMYTFIHTHTVTQATRHYDTNTPRHRHYNANITKTWF